MENEFCKEEKPLFWPKDYRNTTPQMQHIVIPRVYPKLQSLHTQQTLLLFEHHHPRLFNRSHRRLCFERDTWKELTCVSSTPQTWNRHGKICLILLKKILKFSVSFALLFHTSVHSAAVGVHMCANGFAQPINKSEKKIYSLQPYKKSR